MRLFLGVALDDHVRDAAGEVADLLRARLGDRVEARWVPAASLHITLWFIGEVTADRAEDILRVCAPPIGTAPFAIHLAGLGTFPSSGPPRLFWLGVQAGADRLARVHAALATRLGPLGFEPERRRYAPHLTLARVKKVSGPASAVRAALRTGPADAGSCRVDAVTVFRSRLSPKGSAYEALLRVPLQ